MIHIISLLLVAVMTYFTCLWEHRRIVKKLHETYNDAIKKSNEKAGKVAISQYHLGYDEGRATLLREQRETLKSLENPIGKKVDR